MLLFGCGIPHTSHPLVTIQGPLQVWLKANFNLAFTAWIHVKALRVFVESVLRLGPSPFPAPCPCYVSHSNSCRYGIPINYSSFVMVHRPKAEKKLHDYLCTIFGHADDRYLEAEVRNGLILECVATQFGCNFNRLSTYQLAWDSARTTIARTCTFL